METIIIRIHMAYAETFLNFFQCTGEVCVSGPICWPPLSGAPALPPFSTAIEHRSTAKRWGHVFTQSLHR